MKRIFTLSLFLSLAIALLGQPTVVSIKPGAEGKNAFVESKTPNQNKADYPGILCTAWTAGGIANNRSLFQFDLSAIPDDAIIVEATLNLYFASFGTEGHANTRGSNESYLMRITESWDKTTVTWNNQPASTTTNQVLLPNSINPTQDYLGIDVSALVRDMKQYGNHGFLLKLATEQYYRRLYFASGDYADAAKHPELIIKYTTETGTPPAEVTNLTGVEATPLNIELSWADNATNEANYIIERSIENPTNFQPIATLAANTTTATVTDGISNKTRYFFRVKAVDANGYYSYSETISVITGGVAVNDGDKTVCNTYHFDSGVNNPYRSLESFTQTLTPATANRILKFTLNSLSLTAGDVLSIYDGSSTSATKLYDLTYSNIPSNPIIATNAEGKLTLHFTSDDDISKAAGWEAYITCELPMYAPHSIALTQTSASTIEITWADTITNETGFEIQRSVNGSNYTTIATTAVNATSYIDNNVLYSGSNYTYKIRTKTTYGASTWSNAVSIVTLGPIAPSNLLATSPTATSIVLTWTDNSTNEAKFVIERSATPNTEDFAAIAEVPANTTSYTNEGLTTDVVYYYRVKAVSGEYNSIYSNSANTLTGAITMSTSSQSICGLYLLDPGGTSDYKNNEDKTLVLTPSEAGKSVKLTFEEFRTESNWDYLYIYDGPNTSSTLLNKISGAQQTPFSYTASNADGILTLRFTSDGTNVYSGFKAAVSCISIPNAPSNLNVVSATNNSITLGWTDNSTNETKFKIFCATSLDGSFYLIGEVSADVTQFTHNGLASGTTYFYKVFAANDDANSLPSNAIEAKTGGIAAPTLVSLASPDNQTITINWQRNDVSETGFVIERSLEANANYSELATVAPDATSYSDNTVTFGTTYYYRIYAVNATEESDKSEISYFVAGAVLMSSTEVNRCNYIIFDSGNSLSSYSNNEDYTMLLTPQTEESTVKLTFESFATETDNDILYVYDGASTSDPLIATLSGNQVPNPIHATNPTGQLTLRFISNGSNNQSGFKIATSCINQVATPTDLAVQSATGSSITLFWRDNTEYELGYKVYRASTSDGDFVEIGSVDQNITTFTDENLTTGTTYYYMVKAWNNDYVSGASNTLEARTLGALAPTSLTAHAEGNSYVILKWTDNAATETGYIIERSLSATSGFEVVATVQPNSVEYIDMGSAGTTYYYQVKAIADGIESAPSNVASVKVGYVSIFNGTSQGCEYYLLDPGGEANYSNNEDKTITLNAMVPEQKVKLIFQSFNLENNFDKLYIFDGPTANDPLLATLTGTTLPDSIWATNPTGSLTLQFVSDGLNAREGFLAKVACIYIPEGPTNLTLVSATNSSIAINWTSNDHVMSEFIVCRSLTENGTYEAIANTSRFTLSYTDENLETGTQYFYKVYASFYGHHSVSSANLAAATTGCRAPSELAVESTTENDAELTWVDNSFNETSFTIERSLQATDGFEVVGTASANATGYTDTNLESEQTYYYRVKATTDTDQSEYTSVVSVVVGAQIINDAEIVRCNYTILDNGGLNNYIDNKTTWATLTPSEAGKTIKLRVNEFSIEANKDYLALYNGGTAQSPMVGAYTGTAIPDTLWATNTDGKLHLRLSADATNNASGFRIYVGCVDKLAAPTNLVQAVVTKAEVNLQWTDNSQNELGFKVYRSVVSNTGYTEIASLEANANGYVDSNTENGKTYYYKVLAYNKEITSGYSNTLTVVAGPNAIPNDAFFGEFTLYPNPTNDISKMSFSSESMGEVKVEIYTIIGNLVSSHVFAKQSNVFAENIDVNKLQPGLYLLKVTLNGKTLTVKLHKN